ncbi:hypothetical protein Btru_056610 [Bulinus truncatus]|nr:hypothetical protein Btru_056610 [Bulinus truncatus]
MGRPKKGEISYRKPIKKNGVKQLVKPYDKPASGSNRSSMSSEYGQDDVSSSSDVFDNVQPQQVHQDQGLQQQQQQQQSTFNLGTLLHDCMTTVQDWDQKVDISPIEPGPHRVTSHSVAPSSGAVDINENITTEGQQISPHLRNVPSSTHPELATLHHHQSQRIHHQHQTHHMHIHQLHSQQQQIEELDQLPRETHHQLTSFQEHGQNSENFQVMPVLDYDNEHEIPDNRAVKVENTSLQDSAGGSFGENVVLENMQNLQGLKAEYHPYQIHSDNNVYSLAEQRAASVLANCTTVLPISQLEPSSQLVAINMSSPNVIYTPQGQELIIIHNMNQPQVSTELLSHQLSQNHSDMDVSIEQSGQELSHPQGHQGIDLDDGHGMLGHGLVRANPDAHIVVGSNYHTMSHGNLYNDINTIQHQHYVAESNPIESPRHIPSPRSRQMGDDTHESNYTVLASKSHMSDSSSSSSNTSLSSNSSQFKLQGIRSPIAAILQHHKNAIQAGKAVQLSPEEIEELLNTVNADQLRSNQRFLSSPLLLRNQREVMSDQNLVITQHPINAYSVGDEHCREDAEPVQYSQHPNEVRHYLNKSPYQNIGQYPGDVSLSQTMNQARQYDNQTSVGSDSSNSDIHELQRNSYANNNNNNQISHYDSIPHNHPDQNGQMAGQDLYDDSFNSSLFRDSVQLHEINRIFLAIENSCNTYGCNRNSAECNGRNRTDDGNIYSMVSPDDFSPEISHKYWHGFHQSNQNFPMSSDKERIIQSVLDAFDDLQKTYVTNEPEYVSKKIPQDQFDHWHHIQRRIARHVVAGQRFCRNIPGYFKLDIQDRISLGKHVGFGLMVLIACTEFYDSEYRRFKYIWNWTMPMQNPLYSYKLHLLSLGDRIHDIEMDRTEASMLCAISMTSIDCPGLLKPDIVCVVRDVLIDALEAHIATKSDSTQRLQELLSIMPQVRLMTVWYNNLMKKMSVPSDLIANKGNKPVEIVGS